MLRRALLQGAEQLGMERGAFVELVPIVVDTLKDAYPSLATQCDWITHTVIDEEVQFWRSIDKGKQHFTAIVAGLPDDSNIIPGDAVFRLHDTHGIPIEVAEQMADLMNLRVDREGFERCRREAKELSQKKSTLGIRLDITASDFPTHSDSDKYEYKMNPNTMEYEFPSTSSQVLALYDESGARVDVLEGTGHVVLERCQFYAEEGGQASDKGRLVIDTSSQFDVTDVQKINGISVLKGRVVQGKLNNQATVEQQLDVARRLGCMRAHSATHLLHWALRRSGVGTTQRGSSVNPDVLRFDYATGENAGEDDSMSDVEGLVGSVIANKSPIVVEMKDLEEARRIEGLQSDFRQDKIYPPVVRVVQMGENGAIECCSGTHVHNTASIIDFVILSDKSTARGMRRCLAVVGPKAVEARKYGGNVVSSLRTLLNGDFDFAALEKFRKSIDFEKLPYIDAQHINNRIKEAKKTIKTNKKAKRIEANEK